VEVINRRHASAAFSNVTAHEKSPSLEHTPNERYVFVMVTPGKGITKQYRSTVGGSAVSVAGANIGGSAPGWVHIAKADDTYTDYWSKDASPGRASEA
jgi:hypothetical protein